MPLLDLSVAYDESAVEGSTVLITGGASGLGKGMLKRFAELGANVIIADFNLPLAEKVVSEVRSATGNPNHHAVYCDVSSWSSQSTAFTTALSLSTTGKLHHVIANAGIPDSSDITNLPLSPSDPLPEPNVSTIAVDLIGVIYTSRLALHHLRRNSPSEAKHLILVGSMASFLDSVPVMSQYGAAKHGVLGFFRALRQHPGVRAPEGFRINLLCPYFVETPILPTVGRLLLAGVEVSELGDVVDATARLCCGGEANGRVLVIAPRKAGGVLELDLVEGRDIEPFSNRVVGLIKAGAELDRKVKMLLDVCAILAMPLLGSLGVVLGVVVYLWML